MSSPPVLVCSLAAAWCCSTGRTAEDRFIALKILSWSEGVEVKMPLCFGGSTDEIQHKLKGGVSETSALSLSREIIFCKQILTMNAEELFYFLLQVVWKSVNKSACVRIQQKIKHLCDLVIWNYLIYDM